MQQQDKMRYFGGLLLNMDVTFMRDSVGSGELREVLLSGADAIDRIAQLEAELAEARRDTARLDFLQSQIDPEKQRNNDGYAFQQLKHVNNETVRQTIDAAMKETHA